MLHHKYPILRKIDSPDDIRSLPGRELQPLVDDLRAFLIDSVASSGGHFASSLGTVELAVALHYVLDTPNDKLVWDVGHQAYTHKILTGRRDQITSIRKQGGLAPFLKRQESPFDDFGAGHSSTSISAAAGMAYAARQQGRADLSVAIIGDGGLTGGMAFEALNHAGSSDDLNLLVLLNDNRMSISPNVGALNIHCDHLTRANGGKSSDQNFFTHLGFAYSGPIDGHDLPLLITELQRIRTARGPRVLHILTRKGKGYGPAEDDPVKYHGVPVFEPEKGIQPAASSPTPTYSAIFGNWLCEMAAQDDKLIAITPAMCEGSGMQEFARRFPNQYIDVGIAEQHSVTLAGGMAVAGLNPVLAIYSTFLQRAYDQVIHDISLQNLPVLFAIDRAGLVGPDGPTHAGAYDLSYLRSLPNMVLMAPADENECRNMLFTGHLLRQPAAVRYPRGGGPGARLDRTMSTLAIGRAELVAQGDHIALLSFGTVLPTVRDLGAELGATVVNMRFVNPLDTDLLVAIAASHRLIFTVEENRVAGGAGAAVHEYFSSQNIDIPVYHIGLPDRIIDHGTRAEMLAGAGLDAAGIRNQVLSVLARRGPNGNADRLRLRDVGGAIELGRPKKLNGSHRGIAAATTRRQ